MGIQKVHRVSDTKHIKANVRRFNRRIMVNANLAGTLARQTWYWVYDADEDEFAPSKFAGYRNMTFAVYEAAMDGKTQGARFDGHTTQQAIQKAMGHRYQADANLSERLRHWATERFGPQAMADIDQSKWKFIVLPQLHNYWAFFANPAIYDIEAALAVLPEGTWTIKDSKILRGDRVILWRGLKDGKRGIVGLAEVISDPQEMIEPPDGRPFYLGPVPQHAERRVWLRHYVPPEAPLWLEADASGVLAKLSVAKARGGTIFHVTPEQWHQIVELLGGWATAQATGTSSADEVPQPQQYPEGTTKRISVNAYERNPKARAACIAHYGTDCTVCGFDFEAVYGGLGADYTHVHHLNDLSLVGQQYTVDPITDLRPVCPNCHAMLHKTQPAMAIELLRFWMNEQVDQ